MRSIIHKSLVVLIIAAFLSLTVSCDRTVTKYDSNGKPYTANEFSAWDTVGALFLGSIMIVGIASLSFIHGSVDNSIVKAVHPDESQVLDSDFNKQLYINTLENKETSKYKPVQLFNINGELLSEFAISGDELKSNDKIIVRISPAVISNFAHSKFMMPDKITNKIKLSLSIDSDFSINSKQPAIVKIRNFAFIEKEPTGSYYHTTFLFKETKIDFFIEKIIS